MTSDKQWQANRLNALRSTGPRTEEGKASSRINALRHGLTATKIALPGENEAQYEELRAGLLAEYAPTTLAEEILVDRLAGFVWRHRRVPTFEAALHVWFEAHQEELHDQEPLDVVDEFVNPPSGRSLAASRIYGRAAEDKKDPRKDADRLKLGRTLEAMILGGDVLSKLSRYEGHLLKQARETIKELAVLAAAKQSGRRTGGTDKE